MTTTTIWVGHEADAFIIAASDQQENAGAAVSGLERTGMRTGRSSANILVSSPDWTALSDFWCQFRYTGATTTNQQIWIGYNASGTAVARLIFTTNSAIQFQVWNGSAWVNIGATFNIAGGVAKTDIHLVAAVSGAVQIYHGAAGSQVKVLDTTGDYSGAANIVRIGQQANTAGGGFDSDISHCIVQTGTPTLNVTSEIKPPSSDGSDNDGGAAGTQFGLVNETSYNDSNFVALTASGKHQSFKSAARTLTQSVCTGVTISARMWYEGGGPTSVKPYLTIGGTRYYGTTFALDVLPKGYQYTWNLNPATGVAFTVAEANAATLEWGWEAV